MIRELAFAETLRHIGLRDTSMASDLNRLYLEHRFRDIRLYDDVLPTPDGLAPRFAFGLISNGNSGLDQSGGLTAARHRGTIPPWTRTGGP